MDWRGNCHLDSSRRFYSDHYFLMSTTVHLRAGEREYQFQKSFEPPPANARVGAVQTASDICANAF